MMAHLLDHVSTYPTAPGNACALIGRWVQDGALFGKRIISRDDMRAKTKDLNNLLADEKTLIILDDAEVT